MTGTIIQVWFDKEYEVANCYNNGGFRMVETEFPDFQSACQWIDHGDKLIGGAILFTTKRDRFSVITDRVPVAFRGHAVQRVQLPTWRFVEKDHEVWARGQEALPGS